jgi:prevent-host-death family protein
MTMVKNMRNIAQYIPAGEFKSKCLKLMEEVNARHTSFTITKHGKPIAKLIPFQENPKSIIGTMKGSVIILGDIIDSTHEKWEADE